MCYGHLEYGNYVFPEWIPASPLGRETPWLKSRRPPAVPDAPSGAAKPGKDRTGLPGPKPAATSETQTRGAGASRNRSRRRQAGPASRQPAKKATRPPVPQVVGIGASAGGLEAFTELLENLPTDTGMAFVLVQHMAPRPHSLLPEILTRVTRMPVIEVAGRPGGQAQPRLCQPPGSRHDPGRRGPAPCAPGGTPGAAPARGLLSPSLAADQGSRAIGVILSGTASDGVLGLKDIKADGGITFAQDEKTAKYTGMPRAPSPRAASILSCPRSRLPRNWPAWPVILSGVRCLAPAPEELPAKKRRAISTGFWPCSRPKPGWISPTTSTAPSSAASCGAWSWTRWRDLADYVTLSARRIAPRSENTL